MSDERYIVEIRKAQHFTESDSWRVLDTSRRESWGEHFGVCETWRKEEAERVATALNGAVEAERLRSMLEWLIGLALDWEDNGAIVPTDCMEQMSAALRGQWPEWLLHQERTPSPAPGGEGGRA